jgi:hypothetical protein
MVALCFHRAVVAGLYVAEKSVQVRRQSGPFLFAQSQQPQSAILSVLDNKIGMWQDLWSGMQQVV